MLSSLGMPTPPPPVLAPRRKSRQIKVGSVAVGGDAQISVQSMTTTLTSDVNATLQQIAELTATGCDIVRVAVPVRRTTPTRCPRSPASRRSRSSPTSTSSRKYVFAAIDAGCAAVRVNPGNIKAFDDKVGEIAKAAADAGVSLRIGVNAGSLDKRLLAKYGKATPEALVESALNEAALFEEHDFRDFKISVKHNDPVVMVRAYELLAEQCDYPLHLGVTEAGPTFQGTIKSSVAFGALLSRGIGDTIRVSLSAPPVEEVKVGLAILESLNLRQRRLEIVSCPSCGRAQVDVYTLADKVTAGLEGIEVPLRVAVMGCVVNGPGEAREADLGVASGNGKGQIFVRGEVIKTVPESQIVETLIEEALRMAEEMGETRETLRLRQLTARWRPAGLASLRRGWRRVVPLGGQARRVARGRLASLRRGMAACRAARRPSSGGCRGRLASLRRGLRRVVPQRGQAQAGAGIGWPRRGGGRGVSCRSAAKLGWVPGSVGLAAAGAAACRAAARPSSGGCRPTSGGCRDWLASPRRGPRRVVPQRGQARAGAGLPRAATGDQASSLTWVSRKLFPDGSRKPASMPYGRSSGVSWNSTPREARSSYAFWQSSVTRKTVLVPPFASRVRICSDVSASKTGAPGIAMSTIAKSSCPTGPTVSHRKSPISASVTSARTSMPSFFV